MRGVDPHQASGEWSEGLQVRFRAPDGKERTKQFKRKRDAERHVHLVEIDRTQGDFVDPRLGRITVEEWFTRWWPTVTVLRPSTRARDEASFRSHVLPVFGSTPPARLDRTSIREWIATLSNGERSNLAPATVTKAVQVFNKAMRAALEDRLVSANPLDRVPTPRIEREEMRFLNVISSGFSPTRSIGATARSFCWPATAGSGSARSSVFDGVTSTCPGDKSP